MRKDVLIVGGGAAGLMAALFAARGGAKVTLLERNEKLGKKIYITGKGRCNLTNACEREEFMRHILRNPRFLYAALATLDNFGTMELMESLGLPLKTERGERVFPTSDKASDVTGTLARELARLGVTVRLSARVSRLLTEGGRAAGALLENGEAVKADAVILATGGLSYPSTGSTGDGHRMAEETGHALTNALPALVPIETVETWPYALSGLSLRNVKLFAYEKGAKKEKRIFAEQGELLLTHFGISGPLVLTLSSLLPEDLSRVRLAIDLKPALDDGTLDARMVRDLRELSRKQLITVMDGLAPHNLALAILELAGLSPALPANALTHEQRAALRGLFKALPLTPLKLRGFSEAIVTRGGVNVRDVNASTMESKRLPGLYFAGEMLDVDGTTGGFNLQIAFSTGALAGKSAAKEAEA